MIYYIFLIIGLMVSDLIFINMLRGIMDDIKFIVITLNTLIIIGIIYSLLLLEFIFIFVLIITFILGIISFFVSQIYFTKK